MRQWQCPTCSQWVDMSYSKHVHKVGARQPSLGEMIASRNAGRDGEALNEVAELTETPWKPEYPRRDRPDDSR